MLFNSLIFLLAFLPVALIGYFLIGKRAKTPVPVLAFLFVMSCIFIAWMNVWYLVVLLVVIPVNFGFGKLLQKRRTKRTLIIGVAVNILALLFFKYTNFFIETINGVFKTDQPMLKLILPLGISFYTFGNIAYLVDIYKNECEGYSLLEFAAYTAFFPKLVQGPITLHNDLIPQFNDKDRWKAAPVSLSKGLYRFALGLGKKVLLADVLALIADVGYRNYETVMGCGVILAFVSYSLQIYFDFSGYTDMAIGISMMMNIELPENFLSPYKSTSISDFWDRWHITLTKFFTKYLYIPLGGSRVVFFRVLINVMIVFLVSGLWHGANWTFVIWGACHGILMVIERLYKKITKKKIPGRELKIILTFIIVTVLWSLFRADSLSQFATLWSRIPYLKISHLSEEINPDMISAISGLTEIQLIAKIVPGAYTGLFQLAATIGIPVLGLFICRFTQNSAQRTEKFKPSIGKGIVTVGLLVWCILSLSNVTQFIYSNF